MMSHQLPGGVVQTLSAFVCALEDNLQASAHKVDVVMGEHPAFNARWVESHLTRALISWAAHSGAGDLEVIDLGNGGVEAISLSAGVERRFRVRRAERDKHGALQVKSSSDSILTAAAQDLTLFDDPYTAPVIYEQWVLAYLLNPARTFEVVKAGRVVGLLTRKPPYRLRLADVMVIPHLVPPSPGFTAHDDDLDLGDDEEREAEGDQGRTG